jgi:DNA-binding MarR family transcriptional regulator
MGRQQVSYPLEYILEQLDRGHNLEFIAKDAGVQIDSVTRRLRRAEKAGLLEKRYSNILNRLLDRGNE